MVVVSVDGLDRAWAGGGPWTIFKLRLRRKCPIRHCRTALAGTPTAQIPPDTRKCDEMKEEEDAGGNKAAADRKAHPTATLKVHPRGPGWNLACGLRAPYTVICFHRRPLPMFPRLLPRSCRQMSCTWVSLLVLPWPAWRVLQGLTICHKRWHHYHNDRRVSAWEPRMPCRIRWHRLGAVALPA